MDIKQSSEKRFALLIDADNVSAKYIKPITDELSKYGTVTYKRIYGDWTLTLHAKWKDALLENSITPIQQFGYTQGKNATDSAMIIDAMDILYTRSVEGFCIVSSDSDFTRLASRIRESGLTVIGMGEKKTPTPFRKACDIFTTLELLLGDTGGKSGGRNRNRHDQGSSSNGQGAGTTTMSKDEIEQAVVNIITDNQNNGKSTGLGEVGSRLLKRYPDFDVRSYGTNLLSKLLDEFASVQIIKDGSSVAVVLAEGANAPKDASPEAEQAPETKQADDVKDAPVAESEGSTDAQGAAEAKPVEKKPASRRQPRRRKDQVAAQQGSEATEEKPVQASSMIVWPNLSSKPSLPSSLPRTTVPDVPPACARLLLAREARKGASRRGRSRPRRVSARTARCLPRPPRQPRSRSPLRSRSASPRGRRPPRPSSRSPRLRRRRRSPSGKRRSGSPKRPRSAHRSVQPKRLRRLSPKAPLPRPTPRRSSARPWPPPSRRGSRCPCWASACAASSARSSCAIWATRSSGPISTTWTASRWSSATANPTPASTDKRELPARGFSCGADREASHRRRREPPDYGSWSALGASSGIPRPLGRGAHKSRTWTPCPMPCELAGAEMDERGGASRLVTVGQQPFVEVVRRRFRVLLP